MKRQGWAAAVGKVYLTRDGHEVRIINYSVWWDKGSSFADLLGELTVAPNVVCTIDLDEDGDYCGGGPEGTESRRPEHPLDLVEAKLPAAWPVRAALEAENDAKGESHAEQSV